MDPADTVPPGDRGPSREVPHRRTARRAPSDRSRLRVDLVPGDGLFTGLAAGIGHRLGVPIAVVRVAWVVLGFAGGAGLVLYLGLWVIAVPREDVGPPPAGPVAHRKAVALIPILLGVLLLLREVGLWFGDVLVWPVALAGLGALLIGSRTDDADEAGPAAAGPFQQLPVARLLVARGAEGVRRRTLVRVAAGVVLVAVGMTTFLAATDSLAAMRQVAPAVLVTVIGLGLIAGPLIHRLARQLSEERSDRIRSQERADMAAHLHDSVLQTLAMIQRSSSAREMVTLARGQERELRSWLFAEGPDSAVRTLREALDDMIAKAEQRHQISVEPVVVGDLPVDEALGALVDAVGEAVTNAAKHAGVDAVSVYVEVEPDQVTAYVRDAGRGFDPGAVPADRRGISHSICDRLERQGGRAKVETSPGGGTEWELVIPRHTSGDHHATSRRG